MMRNIHEQHVCISEKIKIKIQPLKVVFPSYYGKLYAEEAHALNVELQPDELLDAEMLNENVVNHVLRLSNCAEQAIEAIESEDKKKLSAVLEETKALRDEIQTLQQIIYEDALTKSYNRKWFEDHYLNSDKQSMRDNGAMVMIDLNKFKEINDTYGHIVGDKVLVHIAKKLKEMGGDVIRFGGDEFLVMFSSGESVAKIEEKIDYMLVNCAKKIFKVDENTFKVSFAYGIAAFEQGSELSFVIDTADKSMYRHKRLVQ
ncbi:MAG: diguanylate cyclase [Sulfuricurvum sp.]|uniref:diguanylate cyclase n=1 Tax=Sulfuricurvum sp. TaxID=2025608 RepID=UPI002733E742|nr:diguanylate cyclase [Sulfuricurvum sp.]MDP2850256.1 diguanylate cyclase [Sulfuricurvum sp.]